MTSAADGQFPPACLRKAADTRACQNRQCLFPTPCRNLRADHTDYVNLLRELRAIPGVKKVFIRSGIRFDYLLADEDPTFLRELVEYTSPASSRSRRSTFRIRSCAIWESRATRSMKNSAANMPR